MILQSIQMVQGQCKSGFLSFLWHNLRKTSIGNWLPLMNLQMDTACVYQTEYFKNKTAWTQTNSENEMHAYWYNIYKLSKLDKMLEELRWKLKFPLWAVTLLLTYLGFHLMIKLCLFSLLESFSSLSCFSATQAPNGLRSIFNKAVQYLDM